MMWRQFGQAVVIGIALGGLLAAIGDGYVTSTQPPICDHGPRAEGPFDCSVRIAPGCEQQCDERNGR